MQKETMGGNGIIETAERVVIEYANLSGRESDNRVFVRQAVINVLPCFLSSEIKLAKEEVIGDLIEIADAETDYYLEDTISIFELEDYAKSKGLSLPKEGK